MTIVIVGLGLIGGSLAQASRRKFPRARITGVSRNRGALRFAKKKGWIHEGYRDLERCPLTLTLSPSIVILCTPVDTLKDFLLRLDRLAPPGTIVTDTGSVKGFLVRWANRRKWKRIHFVGAHPMAGSHERGIEHANLNLFEGSLTFVVPGNRFSRTGSGRTGSQKISPVSTVVQFWKKISGRVVLLPAEEHDRITAEISHLPHFLASVLVSSVRDKSLSFATTGFLDTTRVAQASPGLWVPIFRGNRKELGRALRNFERHYREWKKILMKGEEKALRAGLSQARKRRSRITLNSAA